MEPLRTARGEAAARCTTTEAATGSTNEQDLYQNRESGHSTHGPLYTIATPFIWMFSWFFHIVVMRLAWTLWEPSREIPRAIRRNPEVIPWTLLRSHISEEMVLGLKKRESH